jgi:hypothetical protein
MGYRKRRTDLKEDISTVGTVGTVGAVGKEEKTHWENEKTV